MDLLLEAIDYMVPISLLLGLISSTKSLVEGLRKWNAGNKLGQEVLALFTFLLPPKNKENFLGDLLEMQEYKKDEGESKFHIFWYTFNTVAHYFFSELWRGVKELFLTLKRKTL